MYLSNPGEEESHRPRSLETGDGRRETGDGGWEQEGEGMPAPTDRHGHAPHRVNPVRCSAAGDCPVSRYNEEFLVRANNRIDPSVRKYLPANRYIQRVYCTRTWVRSTHFQVHTEFPEGGIARDDKSLEAVRAQNGKSVPSASFPLLVPLPRLSCHLTRATRDIHRWPLRR